MVLAMPRIVVAHRARGAVSMRTAREESRGRGHGEARARERGLTLLEIMIVMLLIGLMMGVMIFGSGQMTSSRLKRSTTMIAGAVRVAFTRATATSRSQRLVIDLDDQTLWLEESTAPMLIQSKDTTGTGGAAAVTEAERAAFQESDRILKGPTVPKPSYHAVETLGFSTETGVRGPRALGRGLKFREAQAEHDSGPRTTGRVYIYFWPGGQTERASIEVAPIASSSDDDTLTLAIAPLTGKVTIKNGPVPLVIPVDDTSASERVDRGGAF
jgi:general secretion pathway protein H